MHGILQNAEDELSRQAINSNVEYTCQQQYLDMCQSHFLTVVYT